MARIVDSNSEVISYIAGEKLVNGDVVALTSEGIKKVTVYQHRSVNFVGFVIGDKEEYNVGEAVPVVTRGLVEVNVSRTRGMGRKVAVYLDQLVDLEIAEEAGGKFEIINGFVENVVGGELVHLRLR